MSMYARRASDPGSSPSSTMALDRDRKQVVSWPRSLRVLAAALLVATAVLGYDVSPAAAHATPKLFSSWGGWADGARPTYTFASSMSLQWMRNESIAGINASGNTRYQNPVFRQITSGTPNVTVGMRSSPSNCAGVYSAWYGCTELITAFSRWTVNLSSGYCWMNGGAYRTCSNKPTFDVWSIIDHEFLHVNNLGHHVPVEGWNSVMDPAFPPYPEPYWQNRAPRGHDLAGLATMYALDPCTTPPCPESGVTTETAGETSEGSVELGGIGANQPGQCFLGGGIGDVIYVDMSELAQLADGVAVATVVRVGEVQYSTEDGRRPSCEYAQDAMGVFSVGRIIELAAERAVAGRVPETFSYWLPGGTLGSDSSPSHPFGLETPDVGDRMIAFLGSEPVDLDAGPGVLPVHAFELMAIGQDGAIRTPNQEEEISIDTVDAVIDPVVRSP